MTNFSSENTNFHKQNVRGLSSEGDSQYIGDLCKPSVVTKLQVAFALNAPVTGVGRTFVPAVKQSAFVTANLDDPVYLPRYEAMRGDALTLTKGQLQSRYKAEYTSLRSRRQQAKHRHQQFDYRLKDIRDWLIHLGPRPAVGWTVDRIKTEKGYQPGNLRWATKIQQTRNRKVTKWHQLPDGTLLTTMQIAKHLGLSYPTVYKRLRNGWDIDRLLQGSRMTLKSWNFPPELKKHCRPLYQHRTNFNQHRIDWFIDYLTDVFYNKLEGKLSMPGDAVLNIMRELNQARKDRVSIFDLQKEFEDQKLKNLLIIMDPTTQPELIQPIKPMIVHPIGRSVEHRLIAKPNPFTLNVLSCQQPLPTAEVQAAKSASALTQKEYNKILNRGLNMPVPFDMEAYEAVIEARTNELEEQGIFPPDAD